MEKIFYYTIGWMYRTKDGFIREPEEFGIRFLCFLIGLSIIGLH